MARLSHFDLRNPQSAGDLYPSGTAEADADLVTLYHDRHLAVAVGELQHILHSLGVVFNIPIDDYQSLFGLGLPGLPGKRSLLFSKDGNLFGHGPSPQWG